MKKFALVLVLLLSLSLVFAACNSTEKTTTSVRWRDEEYTFNITKTSLTQDNVTFNNDAYVPEPFANGYEQLPEKMDEVIPTDIAGTYHVSIKINEADKLCTFATEQTLYCQYDADMLKTYSVWSQLQRLVVTADAEENPFINHEGLITLKSVTRQTVTFKNEASQLPVSSENHVDGFYLGKTQQNVSKYDVVTTYDWEKNVAKVSIDGQAAQENKLSVSAAINFIDSNQILLYVRSLDKSASKFQDNPSVQIYVPAQNVVKTASFAFTHACKTLIEVNGEDEFVIVTAVAVLIDSRALFVQLSVPETVNDVEAIDTVSNAGSGNLDKFSLLRFRSGIIRYELADYTQLENGNKILEEIIQKAEID